MKGFVGVLMLVSGIALAAYAGIWWAFIGGIMDVINEIRSTEMDSLNIAIGVAKVMFAGVIASLASFWLIIPALALLNIGD